MDSYFNSVDGTLYISKQLKTNRVVKVQKTDIEGLAEAYDAISSSLQQYFQPIDFDIADGVCIDINDEKYYIKGITESDNELYIDLFGTEQLVVLPISIEKLQRSTKAVILEAAYQYDAEQTSVFGRSNVYQSDHFSLSALKDDDGCYIRVNHVESPFSVRGEVVDVSEDCFESLCDGVSRVWSCSDFAFNKCIARLPSSVQMYIGDDRYLYIQGLPLAAKQQTIRITNWLSLSDGLALTCCTLQNAIPFQITLSFSGSSIQGTLRSVSCFSLPVEKNNILEDLS